MNCEGNQRAIISTPETGLQFLRETQQGPARSMTATTCPYTARAISTPATARSNSRSCRQHEKVNLLESHWDRGSLLAQSGWSWPTNV